MLNGFPSYMISLCAQDEIILNGFKAAGITEAVESANAVLERIENPFRG